MSASGTTPPPLDRGLYSAPSATPTSPPSQSAMHYPHKVSRIKKVRAVGFRARMATSKGRKILNRKRRLGRAIRVR